MSEPSSKRRRVDDDKSHLGSKITDPRFANIQDDPRYRLPSRKQKIKLDKRFARSFKNEDFVRRARVDRYGRPVENDQGAQRLRDKFDFASSDSESESGDDDEDRDVQVQKELERLDRGDVQSDTRESTRERDLLRQGRDSDSSSSAGSSAEDTSASDDDSDLDAEGIALAQQADDAPLGDVSSRIAVVNLDWDNIRAEDLMAVFSSFAPAGGRLLKVAVYPSEFGKERMEREEMEGPPTEIFAAKKEQNISDDSEAEGEVEDSEASIADADNDEDIKASIVKPDDGSEFDSAALRQYQLDRLRYYYAVLEFSSAAVAKAVYDLVDGTEYLSTANFFDLRFVPDEMDFGNDVPRDECEKLTQNYKPNEFVTDALQHSKVKLTWDKEDDTRKNVAARAFRGGQAEIDENDLKAYLGSDSSSDENEQEVEVVDTTLPASSMSKAEPAPTLSKKEQERAKLRAALGLSSATSGSSKTKDNGPVGNIQVTFSSGLAGNKNNRASGVFENSPEPEETTVEKYVRKEKERKARRKEKMKQPQSEDAMLLDVNEIDSDDQNADDDNDDVTRDPTLGFNDPFFNDADESNAQLKTKLRKEDRQKKRRERDAEEALVAKQRAELELLMADDNDNKPENGAGSGHVVRHFDMAEIERAEKLARKGKKNKKTKTKDKRLLEKESQQQRQRGIEEDDFKLDTADPRLSKLFESHEFAIDPTRGNVRKTKGTEQILDEARKRRTGVKKHGRDQVHEAKDSAREKRERREDGEVRDLVAKIKRRAAT